MTRMRLIPRRLPLRSALSAVSLAGAALAADRRDFLNGVDLGYWPYLSGTRWESPAWSELVWRKPVPVQRWFDGRTEIGDLPAWFARHGVNAMRIRIWTDDQGPFGLEYALALAKRARTAGMTLHPVLFLSDRWADLAKQPRPEAWKAFPRERLLAAVRDHAAAAARRFRDAGLPVASWSVGNETDFGICGAFPPSGIANTPKPELDAARAESAELLAAAIAGVRSVDPSARIVVHLGMTWVEEFLTGWLRYMAAHGVAYDAIGLSYYPSSGPMRVTGTLIQFDGLVSRLHAAFGKPVVVSEYAFPHTADCSRSLFPEFCHPIAGTAPSANNQSFHVARFMAWAKTNPAIEAVYYWSPEWFAPVKAGSPEAGWGPLALFGPDGRALPASRAVAIGRMTPKPATMTPASGATGWVLDTEYAFGTKGNVASLDDLRRLFTHDAPWGRINEELQRFEPFNAKNHVFETDHLALTGVHDGSTNFIDFGHITSGALISKLTVSAPCIVEFTAKLPAGRGCWPSLWLYDTHSGRHDASEIDVMESQHHPPKDDRSMVYQNDHGPGVGKILRNPGKVDRWGWWRPYGPLPGGDMSSRYATYSVVWLADRVLKYVDGKPALTRQFRWTGPAPANLLVYLSIGSAKLDWPGPVLPETFSGDAAVFRLRSIRIFKPMN